MNPSTLSHAAGLPPENPVVVALGLPKRFANGGERAPHFAWARRAAALAGAALGLGRGVVLIGIVTLAIVDGFRTGLMAGRTKGRLARARAAWLHRWSRATRLVLGLRTLRRGHAPVSGIVVARHASMLDAVVLASIHPCVFVAGGEVGRRPLLRLLAWLGGMIPVRSAGRVDLQLATFAIERAVLRRQIVVIFPGCHPHGGFGTALFQPAAELGCSLTAAAICYGVGKPNGPAPLVLESGSGLPAHLAQVLTSLQTPVSVSFDAPRFHRGHRKLLARQLRREMQLLESREPGVR